MRLLIIAFLAFVLSGIYTPPIANGLVPEGITLYRDSLLKILFALMVFEALLGLYQGRTKGPLLRVAVAVVAATGLLAVTSPEAPPLFGWSAPAAQAYRWIGLVVLDLWVLVESIVAWRAQSAISAPVTSAEIPETRPFKPAVKEELPPYGEVLVLLSLLQEKGRFLDFLTEDITKFNDGQVAAASRVVHQGCAGVLREYFDVSPANNGKEGQIVTIDRGVDPGHYRLLGKVVGEPPFSGKLIHRGWKTNKITLPRSAKVVDPNASNVITPAEVELK